MGALTFHEHDYSTEHPTADQRTLEVTTFDNCVEIRIYQAGDERMHNQRVSVILTKTQAKKLVADLASAADYVFGGNPQGD